jgi:transcription initiation factor IIE alpha subunit
MTAEIKNNTITYYHIKNDAIDEKLGEHINKHAEKCKLRVMFNRETEGVYMFGNKKVWMRVE